ncbi:MAG: hypothetical protein WCX61_03015 [Candidatus Peribacteraceae bacterium]
MSDSDEVAKRWLETHDRMPGKVECLGLAQYEPHANQRTFMMHVRRRIKDALVEQQRESQ